MTAATVEVADYDFDAGYRLGFATAAQVEYRRGEHDADDRWTSALTGCTSTWRSPGRDETEQTRTPDWQPCSMKCRRCSRCIASMAYWARGGRPYLGVAAAIELDGHIVEMRLPTW